MIRAYSQRILPPYSGSVQIAESQLARALSFDGINWEFQYLSGQDQAARQKQRPRGYARDRGYFKVGQVQNGELKPYVWPRFLDQEEVADCVQELATFLASAQVPFAPADTFEYWLLDGRDESPLALVFSCCEASQMETYPVSPQWTALPHSKMQVDNTEGEAARGEPPVNHRFQHLVKQRAGPNPRGAWFDRSRMPDDAFPGCLVSEDWRQLEHQDLCQRYIARKSPRLLMLHDLNNDDRERLEIAAKAHALEVAGYYPLYPEVHDEALMAAIRVEARLRGHIPAAERKPGEKRDTGPKEMSRDQRIFET